MVGDRVEIVVDAGGEARSWEVVATKAGRRVEIAHGRGIVEVSEVTRGGTPVRTARFMSSRVLALVEHPASSSRLSDDEPVVPLPRPTGEPAATDVVDTHPPAPRRSPTA